jgi:hypothetical protein
MPLTRVPVLIVILGLLAILVTAFVAKVKPQKSLRHNFTRKDVAKLCAHFRDANRDRVVKVGIVSARGEKGRATVDQVYVNEMCASRVIVTCQPDRWEGDYRTQEAIASGALVLVDEVTYPPPNLAAITYRSLDDLAQKMQYYVANPDVAAAAAAAGRPRSLGDHFEYVLNTIMRVCPRLPSDGPLIVYSQPGESSESVPFGFHNLPHVLKDFQGRQIILGLLHEAHLVVYETLTSRAPPKVAPQQTLVALDWGDHFNRVATPLLAIGPQLNGNRAHMFDVVFKRSMRKSWEYPLNVHPMWYPVKPELQAKLPRLLPHDLRPTDLRCFLD